LQAAKLGNVSALVVCARLHDAAGCPDEAMRFWRRAAKAGHLEGQLLYGLALYRGSAGVAPDAEDAHLWLTRALKQVSAQACQQGLWGHCAWLPLHSYAAVKAVGLFSRYGASARVFGVHHACAILLRLQYG
jgi:TPR repeat protein